MAIGADSAALSGLQAAGQKMTTIGNNVSNADTDGYKSQKASFYSIVAGISSQNSFNSGGVGAVPLSHADEQGMLTATNSGTDIAVSGNGFFIVGKLGAVPSGQTNEFSFTRAGSFLPDKQGYLRNTAGYYLQAWPTDTNGDPTVTNQNSLTELQTARVNQIAGLSTPSSSINLKVNLPSTDAIAATETTQLEVYDTLGASNTLTFTWTMAVLDPLTFNLTIDSPSGTVTQDTSGGAAYSNIPVVFNGSGQPVSYGGAATPPDIYIVWNTAADDSTITLDLGAINTSNGITCTAGNYAELLKEQNGNGVGQFSGISIGEDGVVSALFDNGQSIRIFKIPLANFAAPHKLAAVNGNVFQQTDGSGSYLLAAAKTSGLGGIKSNALEMSTVELANELTEMMKVERYYSGNVKVIQTTQEMFNDLKQIKR